LKFDMYIMAPDPILIAYFINPSLQSVCLYVYPHGVARQWLGESIIAAMNIRLPVEELLDELFPIWCVITRKAVGD
jgi:hypothetical protein